MNETPPASLSGEHFSGAVVTDPSSQGSGGGSAFNRTGSPSPGGTNPNANSSTPGGGGPAGSSLSPWQGGQQPHGGHPGDHMYMQNGPPHGSYPPHGQGPPPHMYMGQHPMHRQQYPGGPPGGYMYPPGPHGMYPPPGHYVGGYGTPPHHAYPHMPPPQPGMPFPVQQQQPASGGKSKNGKNKQPSSTSASKSTSSKNPSSDGAVDGDGSPNGTGAHSQPHTGPSGGEKSSDQGTHNSPENEEEEESKFLTAPMRHDFHFYVVDHKDDMMEAARKQLMRTLSLDEEHKDDNGHGDEESKFKMMEPHSLLWLTNVNERLINKWESEPNTTRDLYRGKEEQDRIRFMNEEEVASRHCATLTARAEKKKNIAGPVTISPEKSLSGVSLDKSFSGDLKSRSRQTDSSYDEGSPAKKLKEGTGEESAAGIGSSADDDAAAVVSDPGVLSKMEEEDEEAAAAAVSDILEGDDHVITDMEEALAQETARKESENCGIVREEVSTANGEQQETGLLGTPRNGSRIGCSTEEEDESDVYVIEKLLNRRVRKVRGKNVKEYLVRWKGFGEESDTWEPLRNVAHLEDEVRAIDEQTKKK
eukprot:CAMPEP_0195534516 /NCGR_PEP_ID=MMETSP0794_2-20130614/42508_1 /TAXON_ID=515487 /ORGANISM="Stephanopyxis turris, Strain CCMP 815" /LENGTH=587 /DNA_ID=CAMNT_0040667387 /DNA_START=107 /DNA_END=1870 /DNA_ORIENTATION=-